MRAIQACAEAEAYLISHALVLPAYHSSSWCLTKINPYSKIHAPFGGLNEKMKNWETNANGYTSEDKGVADQIAAYSAK